VIDQRQRWLPHAIRATFDQYRDQQASAWIKAQGNSMRPLIAPGAQLLVEFGAAPLRVGEIVLFSQKDRLVAHRLVAWRPGRGWTAKGDAEAYADGLLEPGDMLGVVRAVRRSPNESATAIGCHGRFAHAMAGASRWLGRAAALARRAATFLPGPLRSLALRAIPPLIRVVALALFVPVRWAAQIQAVNTHSHERR
jgi:Peptidase S24-like